MKVNKCKLNQTNMETDFIVKASLLNNMLLSSARLGMHYTVMSEGPKLPKPQKDAWPHSNTTILWKKKRVFVIYMRKVRKWKCLLQCWWAALRSLALGSPEHLTGNAGSSSPSWEPAGRQTAVVQMAGEL